VRLCDRTSTRLLRRGSVAALGMQPSCAANTKVIIYMFATTAMESSGTRCAAHRADVPAVRGSVLCRLAWLWLEKDY